jgi:hypothetical protein
MYNARAYSATSATSPLASTTIARRDPAEHDVQIEILYCGICHSDLHSVRNEWSEFMPTVYPIVPGHEIVGRASKLQWELSLYIVHRCLARPESAFQLCVLYRSQHLFESWTGLVACFDQIAAGNQRSRTNRLGRH